MPTISDILLRNSQGGILSLKSADVAHMFAQSTLDWLLIDMSCGTWAVADVAHMVQVVGGRKPVLARLNVPDTTLLHGVLNAGVDGVIIPDLVSVASVEQAVAQCLYPPEGMRPLSFAQSLQQPEKLSGLNDDVSIILELSSFNALQALPAWADIAGIDGLWLAPEKISQSTDPILGINSVTLQNLIEQAQIAAKALDLPLGGYAPHLLAFDLDFEAVASDVALLQQGLAEALPQQAPNNLSARDDVPNSHTTNKGWFGRFLSAKD
jgi:2-keto-3-deoxy-L-rhamnonate aldolase RhmA